MKENRGFSLMDRFTLHLERTGRKYSTCQQYFYEAKRFISFIADGEDPEDMADEDIAALVTSDSIRGYIRSMADGGAGTRAQSRTVCFINRFMEFLVIGNLMESVIDTSDMIAPDDVDIMHERAVLEGREIETLINAPYEYRKKCEIEKSASDRKRRISHDTSDRDSCILVLLLSMGLTREEIRSLDVSDVSLSRGEMLIRNGKGERTVTIPEMAIGSIEGYLDVRVPTGRDDEPLFVSLKGNRMSATAVYRVVRKYADFSGLDRSITTHALRRTCAAYMIESGISPDAIRRKLGFSDMNSLKGYENEKDEEQDTCGFMERIRVNSYGDIQMEMRI